MAIHSTSGLLGVERRWSLAAHRSHAGPLRRCSTVQALQEGKKQLNFVSPDSYRSIVLSEESQSNEASPICIIESIWGSIYSRRRNLHSHPVNLVLPLGKASFGVGRKRRAISARPQLRVFVTFPLLLVINSQPYRCQLLAICEVELRNDRTELLRGTVDVQRSERLLVPR